jgi:Fe-S cluster biogenesis protein NfuA
VQFPAKSVIAGRIRSLYRRRFCLSCSPFGLHNTSAVPPGALAATELAEHRRKRRNAKTYRYQKKKRKALKAALITARGGRCEGCGYNAATAALEFHHRDPSSKEFQISNSSVSRVRLWAEAAKCDLLCANCHRLRHITAPTEDELRTVELRRERKSQAVLALGGTCKGCGLGSPARLLEFHHLDARTKEFSISADGILRSWQKIEAELAKCVLLCANCHRETHAGLRSFTHAHAIGEAAVAYRAA